MSGQGVLNRRITPLQAVVVIGAFAVTLKLGFEGELLAVWGVVLLAVVLLGLLWLVPRLLRPARTVRLEEMAVLPHSCEAVWALIKPAELAPLLDPNIRFGYRVPGAPDGLGERQALEHHDGTTTIIEVIEYEPERRAVTRTVQPRFLETVRSTESVEPQDGGCRYTSAFEVELKAGTRLNPALERAWRDGKREHFERVRTILDSGQPIVAPTRDVPSAPTDQP